MGAAFGVVVDAWGVAWGWWQGGWWVGDVCGRMLPKEAGGHPRCSGRLITTMPFCRLVTPDLSMSTAADGATDTANHGAWSRAWSMRRGRPLTGGGVASHEGLSRYGGRREAARAPKTSMRVPPAQYGMEMPGFSAKYSPAPSACPFTPRLEGSRPCSQMAAMFSSRVPWKTRRTCRGGWWGRALSSG